MGILSWFTDKALGGIGFAIVCLIALVMLKQHKEQRDAGLRGEGRMMCTIDYENKIRGEEQRLSQTALATAQDLLDAERETTGALRNELEQLTGEYQTLKADLTAPSVDDSRCLSDGVFNRLRGGGAGPKLLDKQGGDGTEFPGH